jgi:hypothetical protein
MQAELDLLIRATLLANLPRSGSIWPEEERQEWLRLADTIFKLVYEDGNRSSVRLREINPAERSRQGSRCHGAARVEVAWLGDDND